MGIIYEARPNVTADAVGLCLKSGNAVILRGIVIFIFVQKHYNIRILLYGSGFSQIRQYRSVILPLLRCP